MRGLCERRAVARDSPTHPFMLRGEMRGLREVFVKDSNWVPMRGNILHIGKWHITLFPIRTFGR
jgi:hypothetical protein